MTVGTERPAEVMGVDERRGGGGRAVRPQAQARARPAAMRAAASPSPADRGVSLSRNCRAAVVEIEDDQVGELGRRRRERP